MYQGTSELFNEKIKASSRTFRARLVNTSDSTDVIEKGFRKLTIAQISNEDKRSLSIGGITASELNVEIDNLSGVITGKEFDVQIGLLLDDEQNTYEWVTIGKFTAQKPTIKNNVTSFTAFDRFVSKLGGLYVSRLTYPASGKAILNEIATMSGVIINTDGLTDIMFPQKTVINSSGENVSANPFDGFTYREAIGYVAMAYGKFATVNRNGEVDLRWYTDTNYRIEKNMSYDDISVADTEYSVEYLNVTVNNDRNNPLIKGEGLTGISVGTPIFTTEMLNHAYSQVSGFKYIPTTLSFKGDPRIDLGDIVTVVKYDNTEVKVPVMSLDFDFDGGLICNIGSYGDTEQSEKAYATSPNANKYDRMYTELLLLNQAIANKVTAEYVEAHYVATSKLDAVQAEITQAVIRDLETEFLTADEADIKYANIELSNIAVADVGRLFADVGLITDLVVKDGHITGVLDSVTINANNITSGTLTTDRLVIRGTDKSIVYELNNISGALQAKEVDTLNGEIITPRTINADRIIANSITSGELNADEIFANSAIIKKIFSEDVEATGTITGATLKGAYAEITNGNIGGWYISSNSLYTKKNIGDDIRLAYLQVPEDSLSSWIFSVQSEDLQGNRNGLWYVTANGDQTMTGSLTVDSDVSIGGYLSVPAISGDTTITGNLSVIKDVTVSGYLSANNGLAVYNNGSQAITISNPDSEELVGMYFFNKLGYLGNIYMKTADGGLYRDGHLILDDTNYSNYTVPKTGGSMTGALDISSSSFPMINLTRSGSSYYAGLKFNNSLGVLGAIGMTAVDGNLVRFKSNLSTSYDILDTGNYSSKMSAATQSAVGLMSAADKKKLDGIATGANAYSLPTASSSTLGGVKTTSTVASNSGYTACPIISGVPYYKDTKVTVDSAMSSSSTNPVQNKVVKGQLPTSNQNATNGYIRFPSAKIQIAWIKKTMNLNVNSPWGAIYEHSTDIGMGTWAAAFSSVPAVCYTAHASEGACDLGVNSFRAPTATDSGSVYINRATAMPEARSIVLTAIAIGTYV